jgi:hypothetical protein
VLAERSHVRVSESWKSVSAAEVRVGDTVRTKTGDVIMVSRIETGFFGRPTMLAFIEDTAERWYKRAMATDAQLEIRLRQ